MICLEILIAGNDIVTKKTVAEDVLAASASKDVTQEKLIADVIV